MEKTIVLIFLAALVLRLAFLSPWLEDWDSVQFALALHNFDITLHQPHPPGYPLYIFLGRIFNSFLQNDTLALTSLSAFLGAATGIPFYLLTRNFMGKMPALLSTALLLVTPVHWTLSEVALSNIPGMFFTVTAALLLFKGKESQKYLLAGSLLAGLTLGVRFAEYSILLSLIALVLILRQSLSDLFKSSLALFVGSLIWIIPLIVNVGIGEFIKAYTTQSAYIFKHDSLFADGSSITSRISLTLELLSAGYSILFIPIFIFVIFALFKNPKLLKKFEYLFMLTWLAGYLIPLFLFYNLEDTLKYALPLSPSLAVLTVLGLNNLPKIRFFLSIALITAFFIISNNKVQILSTSIPATIAPVLYVKANFEPMDTILVTAFTYRQFQYYAPEFTNIWWNKHALPPLKDQTIIIDLPQIKNTVSELADYKVVDTKRFQAPKDIFPRVSSTELLILRKPREK